MKGYTIRIGWSGRGCADAYDLVNPSGVVIAMSLSWRTARKLCDLLNADRERRQVER